MGRGIALAFAYADHAVALIDIKPRAADQTARLEWESLGEIGLSLSMLAGLGMFDAAQIPAILARVRFVSLADAGATLTQADVVFDGVPEVLEEKRDALSTICHHIRTDTIVASTTFLVTELAVEFIDFGGNDTLYYASRYLAQAIDPARFAPPAIIEQYMKEGPIGLKAGKGFCDYGKTMPTSIGAMCWGARWACCGI